MPPAEPPIGMYFLVVTYGEPENRSVVGIKKKELYIIEWNYNCIFSFSLSREDKPWAGGEVACLCSVDSTGEPVCL